MPLLYSTVTYRRVVLAKHATCTGNFQEITEHIINKLTFENQKMTYTQPGYLFHYLVESQVVYLCITDDAFDRSRAFMYLNDIKKRFSKTYQSRVENALPYAMQSEFSRVLSSEMRHYSSSSSKDNVRRVEEEIDELKGIMVNNIETISQRGEKLELLVEKADNLRDTSMTFKKSSKALSRAMFMKNLKMIIAIVVIVLVLILIITWASCGADWSKCGSKS